MWHEARRSERKVHELMDAARKRAERRAAFLAQRRGDPQQQLKIKGTRCRLYHDQAMYQATQDQHGLIPWNGKEDNLIDRFDGRALLDFIRESDKARGRRGRTEEEEELEELVNFERYRDLIKRRRRGFSDEQGLRDVDQELDSKATAAPSERQRPVKGTYSQVGFDYDGAQGGEDNDDDDDVDEGSSSGDTEDEETDCIGKDHGIQRFNWLSHMDKKSKAAEKRQKEVPKSDPSKRRLTRKERRKASEQEREKVGHHYTYDDPYRDPTSSPIYRSRKSRSRSASPARSRRHSDARSKKKPVIGKVEYITEFCVDDADNGRSTRTISPPPSPPPSRLEKSNRPPAGGRILEALHGDPAASLSGDWDLKHLRKEASASSGLAKLSKTPLQKAQGEAKETPQERLKRIMSKQLNKQIKKDAMSEMLKKREQERQKQERLVDTRRPGGQSSRSRSYSRSRSRSRSPIRYSRSRSRSPSSKRYARPSQSFASFS